MHNKRRFERVAAGMMAALPRRAGEVQPAAFAPRRLHGGV
jgi:hypothetical protein